MRHKTVLLVTLLLTAAQAAPAETTAEALVAQALLGELRQMRKDLQTTVATIQRIQIVIHRLGAESVQLDRDTQLLDQARSQCKFVDQQRKRMASQIEQNEARRRNAQTPEERQQAEAMLTVLRSEDFPGQEQQCRADQADAEAKVRMQQAKVEDLSSQLDRLDRSLATMESPRP